MSDCNPLSQVIEFFVSNDASDSGSLGNARLVNKHFLNICKSTDVWQSAELQEYTQNLNNYQFGLIKLKFAGTEGKCFHVKRSSDGKEFALKRSKQTAQTDEVIALIFAFLCIIAIDLNEHHIVLYASNLVSLKM